MILTQSYCIVSTRSYHLSAHQRETISSIIVGVSYFRGESVECSVKNTLLKTSGAAQFSDNTHQFNEWVRQSELKIHVTCWTQMYSVRLPLHVDRVTGDLGTPNKE